MKYASVQSNLYKPQNPSSMKKFITLLLILIPLFAIAQPCATINSVAATDVLCNGGNSGSIIVNATATASPISYELNPGAIINATGIFNNLIAQAYTVTASDANLCSATSIVSISQPANQLIISSVQTTGVSCVPGGDGTATITTTGGTMGPGSFYSINNGPAQSTNSFINLSPSVYSATVTDANGCTATSTFIISTTNAPQITSATATNVSCNGGSDGTININVIGGTPAYQFNLNPGALYNQTGQWTNIVAGTYTATVIDVNGCNASTIVTVTQPPQLIINSAVLSNQNPCDIDTISVSAVGGTGTNAYTINPGATTNANGIFYINAGNYTVTVTDANGCTASTLFSNTSQLITLNSSQVIQPTCGQSNGSITANISAGANTVTYILNPGNFTNTTGLFNNLSAAQYTLSAQAASCTGIVDSFLLMGKLNPYPLTNTQNSFTATIPTNGTTPYNYSINSNTIPSPQSSLRCTGIDTFKITDASGCVFDTVFNFVASNNFPAIILNKNITPSTCALTNDGQIVFAPSAPLTFDWIANTAVLGSNANNLSGLNADTYIVKLTNVNGDCIQDTSIITGSSTNCGNIIGKTYFDTLSNCQLDINEIGMPNATVTLNPGNIQRITNANGEYAFLGLAFGNYTISVDTNTALNQYPICNNIVLDTLSSTNISDTIDFPYNLTAITNIYCFTYATPKVPAAPLFSIQKKQWINYGHNSYSQTLPVTVYAVMDSIKHYHSATPLPTNIIGDTLVWQLPNTNFNNYILINFDSLQSLMIGDTIPFKCWIKPNFAIIGNNTNNDTSCPQLPIVTSYDPNDKQVSPQGIGTPGFIELTDSTLSYLVRFQNTGNAMAYNVAIADTISNRLDLNSFEVLDASHPYTIERGNNALRFKFDNIMLPDSNADEPNSHGYILYQIKQSASNILGDVINNTAHIYFDFNSAVVTNTTTNTIGLPVGIESVVKNKQFKIYPNPVQDKLIVQALNDNKIKSIVLTDMLGKRIELTIKKISNDLIELDTQHLTKGIYLLNLNGSGIKLIKN